MAGSRRSTLGVCQQRAAAKMRRRSERLSLLRQTGLSRIISNLDFEARHGRSET